MPNTAYPRRTNGLPGPPPSNGHASHPPPHPPPSNAPPPLSLVHSGPPPQGPSVLQILAMGQERNHAADSIAHHPRIESLVKLGKESEATWLQIGATAETLGDLDRATTSYESALRHNAYSIVALSQIAAICRSKEEFKKAAEYFGRVVDIAPESGDVWGALGHCYLMIDDLKKAYSSYQQALYYMSNPQEPKLWYGIGILYDRYGSLEHAEEAFSSVIRMDPGFEKANEIFFRLGIIYKQQRKSAQSLECFRYILQNPPRPLTEIDIWFQIGHVYEQQKDYLAAKESYERVLVENPAHAKVLQQLGGLYHRSRAPFYNPELSVNILTKSLESDANDPFSWYLLGRAYMTTNNFGKAYEAYQQAVYRDGKNPAFWCSIGVLYYNINQFHDALDAYSRAIRIHPYLAEVWFNLGALYESCNDQMTDAIDAYQRTLQLDPSNAIVATRLREIQIHQSTGAPLSSPPTPKDISPSSLSWNYATNAGGAPAHPSGLGLELSPALSRPGGASAGSPPTGHRFEGPPPNRRSDSTETYRNEDRQRASGSMAHHSPSTSMDHSPHISRRISGPLATPLPQIKPHENRDSPRISSASASDIHRRPSPLSPRTRHSDSAHDNPYPPHSSYPGPPSGSHSSYPRPGDSSEMDWYRNGNPESRNGSSGGRGIPSQPPRRSPPHGSNSRDPRDYPSGPPAPGFDRNYASPGPPGSSSRPSILRDSDPRGPPPAAAPYPSQHFPGYGQYPPQHPYQPFYDPNMRRQDVREREEEDERRRGSGPVSRVEASPPRAPTPAMLQGDREGSVQSVGSNGPSTAVIPKGRGGRTARGKAITVKKETSTSRSRRTAKEGSDASPPTRRRGGNKMDGGSPTKRSKSGAAQTGPSKATSSADNASDTSKSSLNHSTTPIPFVPSSTLAAREIDEDYDEGVDALMGLATSHGKSPSLPAPSPPVAVVPARTETPIEGSSTPDVAADDQAIETEKEVNPRKRPLESPPLEESESKRTKNDSEAEVEPKIEVDVEVDSVTESAAEPAPEATPVPETTPSAAETEPEAEETVVKAQEAAVAEEATTEAAVEESVEESMEAEVEAPVVEEEAQPKIESLTPPATDDAEPIPAVDVEKSEEIAEAEKEMEVEEGEVLADAKPISEKESSPVEESVA